MRISIGHFLRSGLVDSGAVFISGCAIILRIVFVALCGDCTGDGSNHTNNAKDEANQAVRAI